MSNRYSTTIVSTSELVPNTFEVTISRPDNFEFKPGQYLQLGLQQLAYSDPKGKSRSFSIASSPNNRKLIKIAFRHSGSGFKKSLLELAPDASVTIEGPHGVFVLNPHRTQPAVLIAGGIGITPFMSMLRYANESGDKQPLQLLYANRSRKTAAYLAEITSIVSENKNMEFSLIQGRLTSSAIDKLARKYGQDARWYLAGPSGFVAEARYLAEAFGSYPENVFVDNFVGY